MGGGGGGGGVINKKSGHVVNDKTKLVMLGMIPNRVTGFREYTSLFTCYRSIQVARASLIAHLSTCPGETGSISTTCNMRYFFSTHPVLRVALRNISLK